MSQVFTPMSAEGTGLIPDGYSVEIKDGIKQDFLEGETDLKNLDFSFCPIQQGEEWIELDAVLVRAKEENALGSLGLAAVLLQAQDEGEEVFPPQSRGEHLFIMPRTVLLGPCHHACIGYFYWDMQSERWKLDFIWIDHEFYDDSRFIRRR